MGAFAEYPSQNLVRPESAASALCSLYFFSAGRASQAPKCGCLLANIQHLWPVRVLSLRLPVRIIGQSA